MPANNPLSQQNPFYPYQKVITGANTLKGAELIPYKLLMYLLDLPDAYGHIPFEDNTNPRARLMRYLWNDGARPLDGPLPTPEEKRSMLFDPDRPDINTDEDKRLHPKGYRLFMQRVIGQSGIEAKTLIKCYITKLSEPRKFHTTIGIAFEVWTNVNLEANTRSVSFDRTFAMEQCLHDALDGVNIGGVGTVSFARADHSYNGSEEIWTDASNLGRLVNFSVQWAEGGGEKISGF